ncbi:MAG: hypothetical protein AAF928_21190 [Myxococcota bacterium]
MSSSRRPPGPPRARFRLEGPRRQPSLVAVGLALSSFGFITTSRAQATPEGAVASDRNDDAAATTTTTTGSQLDARDLQREDGLPKPDPADLRTGHIIVGLGGGLWVPSSGFTPDLEGFGRLDLAGGVHGEVGFGLSRHVVLGLAGGYTRLTGARCAGCAGNSGDVGLRVTGYIAQGFGLEPWASFGVGYRYTRLTLGGLSTPEEFDRDVHAFDLARFVVGAAYHPVASVGVGPYLGADIGLRDVTSSPRAYGAATRVKVPKP